MACRRHQPTGRPLGSALAGLIAIFGLLACTVPADPEADIHLRVSTAPGAELAFEPGYLVAPAHVRVSLDFRNSSPLDHNLIFLTPLSAGTRAIVRPGTSDTIEFDLPPPGTYRFVCSIHEGMTGTLETR